MGNYEEAKSFVGTYPGIPHPSYHADMAKGRLLEKEPTNLQAQSLNTLIEDQATRGESPQCFQSVSLTHSPRRIHRNGYRRRRSSRRCSTAHELSKAGRAQIIPTYNRFSNAVAFAMLSLCSRIQCLSI